MGNIYTLVVLDNSGIPDVFIYDKEEHFIQVLTHELLTERILNEKYKGYSYCDVNSQYIVLWFFNGKDVSLIDWDDETDPLYILNENIIITLKVLITEYEERKEKVKAEKQKVAAEEELRSKRIQYEKLKRELGET